MAGRRRQPQREVEWHFFSFPVAFALAMGAFLASMIIYAEGGGYSGFLHLVIHLVSLFGVSFGFVHLFGQALRRRTTAAPRAGGRGKRRGGGGRWRRGRPRRLRARRRRSGGGEDDASPGGRS